jgi:Family of unknown function (DUF6152)
MRMRTALLTGVAVLASVVPLLAHHSIAAEFDTTKPLTLKGTIAKVEWSNPHIWFYVDVKDASGKVARWQCEGGAPNSLTRSGWTKNSLKQGDEITVDGDLAKDGMNTLHARTVKFADGKTVFAGNNSDPQ